MLTQDYHPLPLLTADLPGIGGQIKCRPEDFLVEEIPLYRPCGTGTHLYALLEKTGISTPDAIGRIGHALNIHPSQIGYAGLKDARAVTRQWISIEHIEPQKLHELDLHDINFSQLDYHGNKIKVGHLAANRFVIRLRHLTVPLPQALAVAEQILPVLTQHGVPNYYGPQRFGLRGESHLLGYAILRNDPREFIHVFLGRPIASDPPVLAEARRHYEKGEYQKAYDLWPVTAHNRRRALQALMRPDTTAARAVRAIDKKTKRFFISACQSALFNQVLAARMPNIDQLMPGDLAYKHISGACFSVQDLPSEQPRCQAFEISPSGPIFGYQMKFPLGAAAQIEQAALDVAQLKTEHFRTGPYKIKGVRRPLRFQPRNTAVSTGEDDLGEYLQLQFELDSGCYATTLLQEITKTAQAPGSNLPARPVVEQQPSPAENS